MELQASYRIEAPWLCFDPAAPGTHSFYMVRINPGPAQGARIEIVQGMLPPH